jgi:hypothetical protein
MMSQRTRLIGVIAIALLGAGAWASAQIFSTQGSAQLFSPQRADQPVTLSGNDIGFRIEGRRGDTVVGRLMVRVDGEWVDAEFGGGVRRLH